MTLDVDFKGKIIKRCAGQACRKMLLDGIPRDYVCKITCQDTSSVAKDGSTKQELEVCIANPVPAESIDSKDRSSYYYVGDLSKLWG